MPEPLQRDNDPAQWRRELERERLARLSISEGEGLPGPGAVAASAIHPTPPMIGGEPTDWSRQLERDRLSMQAVAGETEYPGPGAIGALAKEAPNPLAGAMNPAAAAKAMKEAMDAVQKAWPKLETRGRLWQLMSAAYGVLSPIPLFFLPFHKIMFDPQIKDVAIKVKTAVRKTGIPLPPQAQLIVKLAPWLPPIEWLALLLIYCTIAFVCMLVLTLIGMIGCMTSASCLKDIVLGIGRASVNLFKSIL